MEANPEKMQAWQYSKYGGGIERLEKVERPVPKPGPSEVLLKVTLLRPAPYPHALSIALPTRLHISSLSEVELGRNTFRETVPASVLGSSWPVF
jgi:hypothetical protein